MRTSNRVPEIRHRLSAYISVKTPTGAQIADSPPRDNPLGGEEFAVSSCRELRCPRAVSDSHDIILRHRGARQGLSSQRMTSLQADDKTPADITPRMRQVRSPVRC
jgi:hypothetical protein